MQIEKVLETPEGSVTFKGTLAGNELEAVIAVGLLTLLQAGALPYLQDEEGVYVFDEPETHQ